MTRQAAGTGVSDQRDLEALFRAHYPRVVSTAARITRSTTEAEDVAQEAFVSLARSSVPDDEALAWLTVAAAHLALNAVRSQRRREVREARAAQPESLVDPADIAMNEVESDRIRRALRRLPRTQALVLVLRHSGFDYAEIASATGLSPNSIGTTLRRAESALRKELP